MIELEDRQAALEYLIKNICSGLEVKFSTLAERCFKVNLSSRQAQAIDWSLDPELRTFEWNRESGSSFCAVLDACFSFLYFDKKVMVVAPCKHRAQELIKQAKEFFYRSHYPYLELKMERIIHPANYSGFRNNSFIHFVSLAQFDLVGKNVDKIIFDNCFIDKKFKNIIVRKYLTY
jgi:hypothetical protein